MSHFSQELQRLMAEVKPPINNLDLVEATGKSASQISRMVRGLQTYVDARDFIAIAQRVSRNPQDHALLARARALDSLEGPPPECKKVPGGDRVEVRLRIAGLTFAEEPVIKLHPRYEAGIDYLRQLISRDPRAGDTFIGQMELMGMPPFQNNKKKA